MFMKLIRSLAMVAAICSLVAFSGNDAFAKSKSSSKTGSSSKSSGKKSKGKKKGGKKLATLTKGETYKELIAGGKKDAKFAKMVKKIADGIEAVANALPANDPNKAPLTQLVADLRTYEKDLANDAQDAAKEAKALKASGKKRTKGDDKKAVLADVADDEKHAVLMAEASVVCNDIAQAAAKANDTKVETLFVGLAHDADTIAADDDKGAKDGLAEAKHLK